jgi:SNF2 family DNA or RNA helicase
LFANVCKLEGWKYLTYESDFDCKQRDAVIKDFKRVRADEDEEDEEDDDKRDVNILLIATGVGSEGLNLTMANRVLIFSPWWYDTPFFAFRLMLLTSSRHESKEIQSFCRVWRLGQLKECYLKRFIMQNTVEEHMLNVQRMKQADINAVMLVQSAQRIRQCYTDNFPRSGGEVSEEAPQIRTTIKFLFNIDYKGPTTQKKKLK